MQKTGRETNPHTNLLNLRDPDHENSHAVIVGRNSQVDPSFRIAVGRVISKSCTIAPDCVSYSSIGQHVTLERGVRIGRGAKIGIASSHSLPPNHDIVIGEHCLLDNNVHIYPGVSLGSNTHIEQGAHIGFLFGKAAKEKRQQTLLGIKCKIGAKSIIDAGVVLGNQIETESKMIIPHVIEDRLQDIDNTLINKELIMMHLTKKEKTPFINRLDHHRVRP